MSDSKLTRKPLNNARFLDAQEGKRRSLKSFSGASSPRKQTRPWTIGPPKWSSLRTKRLRRRPRRGKRFGERARSPEKKRCRPDSQTCQPESQRCKTRSKRVTGYWTELRLLPAELKKKQKMNGVGKPPVLFG